MRILFSQIKQVYYISSITNVHSKQLHCGFLYFIFAVSLVDINSKKVVTAANYKIHKWQDVSEMTYDVSSGTLKPTIPYHT